MHLIVARTETADEATGTNKFLIGVNCTLLSMIISKNYRVATCHRMVLGNQVCNAFLGGVRGNPSSAPHPFYIIKMSFPKERREKSLKKVRVFF
jgi:hypothetical protein